MMGQSINNPGTTPVSSSQFETGIHDQQQARLFYFCNFLLFWWSDLLENVGQMEDMLTTTVLSAVPWMILGKALPEILHISAVISPMADSRYPKFGIKTSFLGGFSTSVLETLESQGLQII